ncbi:MAG: hypothetical protein QOG79_3538, partial [Mycobacterium sp.]|nr:hypothetical protein [Mycobacterium sp.]
RQISWSTTPDASLPIPIFEAGARVTLRQGSSATVVLATNPRLKIVYRRAFAPTRAAACPADPDGRHR